MTLDTLEKAIENINSVDISSVKYLQHELNIQLGAELDEDNIPDNLTLGACPLLKLGASGNITKWVQNKLGIDADGIFGNQTLIAVQNFQAAHGLVADGIINVLGGLY